MNQPPFPPGPPGPPPFGGVPPQPQQAQPPQPYGVPQQQPYGVSQPPAYGVPQQQPYGVPQPPAYGVPQQQPYGVPQQQPYGVPQQQPYGVPQPPAYGAPQPQPFGAPAQPPAAYGMPPQPSAPQAPSWVSTAPSFGAVVPAGKRTKHPRLTGAGMLGVGIIAAGINGYMLIESNKFYPKLLIFTPMLLLLGAWMLVFGQPIQAETGKPPLWWSIGMGLAVVGGLVFGVFGAIVVGC